jgi:hypothetical protein
MGKMHWDRAGILCAGGIMISGPPSVLLKE